MAIRKSGWEKGFNWVYREEVVGQTGALDSGQVVDIRSRSGKELVRVSGIKKGKSRFVGSGLRKVLWIKHY